MQWSEIIQYFRPETAVIAAMLWCLGLFLKKAPAFKAEWSIPFILLGVALVLTPAYLLILCQPGEAFGATVLSGLIQGVFAAAVAVFGNELKKQVIEQRPIDKEA